MKTTDQTYTDLSGEGIEDRKRRRLEEDSRIWGSRLRDSYVPLSVIKDYDSPA